MDRSTLVGGWVCWHRWAVVWLYSRRWLGSSALVGCGVVGVLWVAGFNMEFVWVSLWVDWCVCGGDSGGFCGGGCGCGLG